MDKNVVKLECVEHLLTYVDFEKSFRALHHIEFGWINPDTELYEYKEFCVRRLKDTIDYFFETDKDYCRTITGGVEVSISVDEEDDSKLCYEFKVVVDTCDNY